MSSERKAFLLGRKYGRYTLAGRDWWFHPCQGCGAPLLLPLPRVPWCCAVCFGRAAAEVRRQGDEIRRRPRRLPPSVR